MHRQACARSQQKRSVEGGTRHGWSDPKVPHSVPKDGLPQIVPPIEVRAMHDQRQLCSVEKAQARNAKLGRTGGGRRGDGRPRISINEPKRAFFLEIRIQSSTIRVWHWSQLGLRREDQTELWTEPFLPRTGWRVPLSQDGNLARAPCMNRTLAYSVRLHFDFSGFRSRFGLGTI